jgi:hypothetical protein
MKIETYVCGLIAHFCRILTLTIFIPAISNADILISQSTQTPPQTRTQEVFSIGTEKTDLKLTVKENGVLQLGAVTMFLDFRDGRSTAQDGRGVVSSDESYPKAFPNDLWVLKGLFRSKTSQDPLVMTEVLERVSDHSVKFGASLEGQIGAGSLRWIIRLPSVAFAGQKLLIDGTSRDLPKEKGSFAVGSFQAQEVIIPLAEGRLVVRAPVSLTIGDNRFYNQEYFSLILEQKNQAVSGKREFSCEIGFEPYRFQPVDIRSAANMGFRDEVAGDQRGGWTDQGQDNDMSGLPTRFQMLGDIPFDLIDEASNNGRACMVFAGPERVYFPMESRVPLSGESFRTLFLLHAFAFDRNKGTPLGQVIAQFADGSQQEIPVTAHVEASNWTAPYNAPNGTVAWRGPSGRRSEVGLNLSRFDLPGKPIASLNFKSAGKAVWMVTGITGSEDNVPGKTSSLDDSLVMAAGEEWQPVFYNKDVQQGSVMDFSFLLDAPAGKYGHLVTKGGHFVFADQPNMPVRFWGNNLCWGSNFIDKPSAERLARRLARMGYNSIRLHHFDGQLLKADAKTSHDIDPDKLDRLDYLFACLKNEGIYVNMDLYCNRTFRAGEIDEIDHDITSGIKAAVAVSPSALSAWKTFAAKLMTHTNAYTGMTYAEDPALIGICPINENVLQVFWSSDAAVAQLINQRFDHWLSVQGLKDASKEARSLAFDRFLSTLQIASQQEIARFLKEELNVHALLTDVNHRDYKPLTLVRSNLDYVDVHRYWDHPRFAGDSWGLPYLHSSDSIINKLAEVPRVLFPARLSDKPFAVTEYNYCFPNPYRGESGPIMGAYAALQDWDAVYRFNYNGNLTNSLFSVDTPMISLNIVNDPISVFSDRLTALLFLRGDVTPAEKEIVFEIDPGAVFSTPDSISSFSEQFSTLGLVTRLGSMVVSNGPAVGVNALAEVTEPNDTPSLGVRAFSDGSNLLATVVSSGIVDPELMDLKNQRFKSITGEIVLDKSKGRFSVITDKTEAFVFAKEGAITGQVAVVEASDPCVVSVSAMDGNPLATTGRMLILHLTDAQNGGSRFRNKDRNILEEWGDGPVLVRRGSVMLRLKKIDLTRQMKCWVVGLSGERMREIQISLSSEEAVLNLQTITTNGVALAYELEINP